MPTSDFLFGMYTKSAVRKPKGSHSTFYNDADKRLWILPISRLWDRDLQRSAAARRIPDRDAAVMQRHKLLRDAQAQTQAGIGRVCGSAR